MAANIRGRNRSRMDSARARPTIAKTNAPTTTNRIAAKEGEGNARDGAWDARCVPVIEME